MKMKTLMKVLLIPMLLICSYSMKSWHEVSQQVGNLNFIKGWLWATSWQRIAIVYNNREKKNRSKILSPAHRMLLHGCLEAYKWYPAIEIYITHILIQQMTYTAISRHKFDPYGSGVWPLSRAWLDGVPQLSMERSRWSGDRRTHILRGKVGKNIKKY